MKNTLSVLFLLIGFASAAFSQVLPKENVQTKQDQVEKGELKINPNPTSGDTFVSFYLEKGTNVDLSVFNAIGKRFKQIALSQYFHEGVNTVQLKTAELLPGMYFVEMNANNTKLVKRLYITSN